MNRYEFKYDTPADGFCQGHPIGNGKLGAMILGNPDYEKIIINDETLYGRYPMDENNYGAYSHLQQIRNLIFEGRELEAEEIIDSDKISGTNTESYLALGNIYIDFGHKNYGHYYRSLSLDHAIQTVAYEVDDVKYQREAFVSAVSGAMTMRFVANKPGSISFALHAGSHQRHQCRFPEEGLLRLEGKAPDVTFPKVQYEDGKAAEFEMLVQVIPHGGSMRIADDRIVVENADDVVMHVVTDTGYIDYRTLPEKNPHAFCEHVMTQVRDTDYEKLKREHIEEYQKWFQRVSLDLGEENRDYELNFQFGRYLLISSSRPHNQAPANLQGIWSEDEVGDYQCAYTLNINLPMNYWMAETTGLTELNAPLFQFIKNISENGKKTAQVHYGCDGWCTHHNVAIYCKTSPFTNMRKASRWGMWPMAGLWLCHHLWEHYLFTLERTFLKEAAYPIMKGAALFCVDFLCEKDGYLVSCPSTSPEISYYNEKGEVCGVSYSTTMDICMMRDLFDNCMKAAHILQTDEDFAKQLADVKYRLLPIPINEDGVLQEYVKDYEMVNKGSTHISPLYGLYPANIYSKIETPDYYEAAKKFFRKRQPNFKYRDQMMTWGTVWHACIEARLGDGEGAAEELLRGLHAPYPLFHGYEPSLSRIPGDTVGKTVFQIDGSMGFTAAVVEMLLQSHDGIIEVLPAVPKVWKQGSYRNFCARGGITVSATWTETEVCVELVSAVTQEATVVIGCAQTHQVALKAGVRAVLRGTRGERF